MSTTQIAIKYEKRARMKGIIWLDLISYKLPSSCPSWNPNLLSVHLLTWLPQPFQSYIGGAQSGGWKDNNAAHHWFCANYLLVVHLQIQLFTWLAPIRGGAESSGWKDNNAAHPDKSQSLPPEQISPKRVRSRTICSFSPLMVSLFSPCCHL